MWVWQKTLLVPLGMEKVERLHSLLHRRCRPSWRGAPAPSEPALVATPPLLLAVVSGALLAVALRRDWSHKSTALAVAEAAPHRHG